MLSFLNNMITLVLRPVFSLLGVQMKDIGLSFWQVLIYSFIPFGQLFARIIHLRGSMDKLWLMLAMIPPFSLIAMTLIKYGFVKKGEGSKPYDLLMVGPIVYHFFIYNFIRSYFKSPFTFNVVYTIGLLLLITGILTYRLYVQCDFKFNQIGKALVDAPRIVLVADYVPVVLRYTPFVGKVLRAIQLIPVLGKFVHDLIWSFSFIVTYVLNNMWNQRNMDNLCSSFGSNIDKIIAVVSIIAIAVLNVFT